MAAVLAMIGWGVVGSYEKARPALILGGAQDTASTQFHIGVRYYFGGDGVPQDYIRAVRWFLLAAAQGDVSAQSVLADMYKNGDGVPQDALQAANWYRAAAAQGNAMAQANLGFMYLNGYGVPQDFSLAHMWSNLSGAENEMGRQNLDIAAESLTSSEIAQAQRLARKWKPQSAD